jgi:UDP-N-acetylglucosamine 1-carboxyvinyltransferase
MATLRVNGGRPLKGKIRPSANKNAVLPTLCSTLLTSEPVTLHRVPDITDVRKILSFFKAIGSDVDADFDAEVVRLHHRDIDASQATLPKDMRSSVMLVPGLMHRFGRAVLEDDSKGCTLGLREIDPHIDVFKAFGASVGTCDEGIVITAPASWEPANLWLDYASVTTTENFLMCAALAGGQSRLVNAACEPHVQEFCRFLKGLGVEIDGEGASTLDVRGGKLLGPGEIRFEDDFHEVATFLALGAITGGHVEVQNSEPDQFGLIDRAFAKFGVTITHKDGWSSVRMEKPLQVMPTFTPHMTPKIEAAPWPYMPADLLPIFLALGVRADGEMMFWNKVYEGALGWTTELGKFGAPVLTCDPHRVVVFGGKALAAAEVESPYIIRAAIALFMVAASIPGLSVIHHADPIRRAHPDFAENLRSLGADVSWDDEEVDEPAPQRMTA